VRIKRLQLRDVRRYVELDIDLAPGLTVIRGPNEAGKSTIQRAIELALTRRATSSSADLDALKRWDSGADARPEISLEFEQEDEDGVRTGRLTKAFRGNRGSVDLEYDGQAINDPALADQVLAELTGIPSEGFFRSTASVRHHELAVVDRDEAALRDRLQASLSGADRGTSRARKLLDRALHDLNTRGDKNPGMLKQAEAMVAAETEAVNAGESGLAALERDRETLVVARTARAAAEAHRDETRSLLEKARQAERLIAERDAAQDRFERYRTAVQVRDELEELRGTHPSRNPVSVLRKTVERLRELDGRMRELRAMLSGEIEVRYEVAAPEPRSWRPTAIAAVGAILIGVLIAAASALNLVTIPSGVYIGLFFAAVGAVLAIVGRRQRRDAQGFEHQKSLQESEVDRRLRGRSLLEQELTERELAFANELSGLELPDMASAEDLLKAEEEHVAKIDRLTAQLDGLVGREPPETLPAVRDAAALEIDQKSGALEALGPIAKEPRARERLEGEVAQADKTLETTRDEEAAAKARVDANTTDAEAVAGHVEALAEARETQAAAERRARVYAATLRAIDEAERATMRRATRYLERRMVGDVERVTDGRYRRIRVNDQTLGIELFAPERGDWVDVSTLSQGTLDLVYLAARLGLVRLVTGDRRPPLLFDDPFVTLDDARASRALALLREIAADFQVIYLTTSERYDGAADSVVVLDGPSLRDDGAALEEAAVG
jgi:DNA repair exonuclease SbcCD ATPase subunit